MMNFLSVTGFYAKRRNLSEKKTIITQTAKREGRVAPYRLTGPVRHELSQATAYFISCYNTQTTVVDLVQKLWHEVFDMYLAGSQIPSVPSMNTSLIICEYF